MNKLPIAAVAAASLTLSACATTQTSTKMASRIDRASAAYERIANSTKLILPFLSEERAARVRLALALAELGLRASRDAVTTADQIAALKQAEAATATVVAVVIK